MGTAFFRFVPEEDSRGRELLEKGSDLLGRGDLGGQEIVDLVVEQVPLASAERDEIADLSVLAFELHRKLLFTNRPAGQSPGETSPPLASTPSFTARFPQAQPWARLRRTNLLGERHRFQVQATGSLAIPHL